MEEQVKVLRIEVEGTQTVQGLRKEISDLRDALLNCEEGSEDYRKVVDQLVQDQKTLASAMNAGKNGAENVAGSYNALQAEMTALRKVWKEVGDEASRNEIGARIMEINTQLKEMDSSIGNNQRKVGSYEEALKTLSKEFTSQKQEMRELKLAMENLDPATEAYQQAFDRCAEITHNLAKQQEALRYASPDLGDQLSNVRGIAANMAAGFSAAQAAMGLFGKESEDVQKAMLRVQQGMALVQGLEGLDGFIKRTQGLSDAMAKWMKSSKDVTTQTVVQGTAMKAEAAATTAQTAATEGATVAQEGLNTAMKANPVGLILGVLALLVANWEKVRDAIVDVLGGQEKVNKVMERAKPIIAGIGSVISNSLLMPLRLLISNLKTVSTVIGELFKGNFRSAIQAAKSGIEEQINIAKNGLDVVGNFQSGANKKVEQLQEEHTKKLKEQYDKDKENYIKDEEAKHGKDWKYTEEGKKAYEALYKNRAEMYKKDTEEYRQNQRDMWQYDKDYQDRITKGRLDEAKKRKQIHEEEIKAITKAYTSLVDKLYTPTEESLNKMVADIKAFNDYVTMIGRQELLITTNVNAAQLEGNVEEVMSRLQKHIRNNVSKSYADVFLNEIAGIESASESIIIHLEQMFQKNKITSEIIFPDDEIFHINSIFDEKIETAQEKMKLLLTTLTNQVRDGSKEVDSYIEMIFNSFNEGAIDKATNSFNKLVEGIKYGEIGNIDATYIDTEGFKKMEEKLTEILFQYTNLRVEKMKSTSDIMKKYYEDTYSSIDNELEQKLANRALAASEQLSSRALYTGFSPNEKKQQLEDEYNLIQEYLDKEIELYAKASIDESLTFEDRAQAKAKYDALMIEKDDAIRQHIIDNNNLIIESYKTVADSLLSMSQDMASIMGSVSDIILENAQAQLEAGKISQSEYDAQFEKAKDYQIAQATINTISGAVGAFTGITRDTGGWGIAAAAVQAAAVIAAGFAQIKQIRNTKPGSGSSQTPTINLPKLDSYQPEYTQNATRESDIDALKNAIGSQKIYVSVTDINKAQNANKTKVTESTF